MQTQYSVLAAVAEGVVKDAPSLRIFFRFLIFEVVPEDGSLGGESERTLIGDQ